MPVQVIVEWRALTVCLLDEVAAALRQKLGKTEKDFPLVKVRDRGFIRLTPARLTLTCLTLTRLSLTNLPKPNPKCWQISSDRDMVLHVACRRWSHTSISLLFFGVCV